MPKWGKPRQSSRMHFLLAFGLLVLSMLWIICFDVTFSRAKQRIASMDVQQWLLLQGGRMNYITIANFTFVPLSWGRAGVELLAVMEDVDPQEFSIPVRDMQENSDLFLAVRFWQLFSRGRSSQWFPYLRVTCTFLQRTAPADPLTRQLLPSSDEYARFHPMYADDVVMQACSALPTIQKVSRRPEARA
eukprot:758443-Hanusia_phi.AAC.8